jgi:hypothetical protein
MRVGRKSRSETEPYRDQLANLNALDRLVLVGRNPETMLGLEIRVAKKELNIPCRL